MSISIPINSTFVNPERERVSSGLNFRFNLDNRSDLNWTEKLSQSEYFIIVVVTINIQVDSNSVTTSRIQKV